MYKELEKFANDHTLAKDVTITVSPSGISIMATEEAQGAKYEDVTLLYELIRGAEHYLLWKRRRKK